MTKAIFLIIAMLTVMASPCAAAITYPFEGTYNFQSKEFELNVDVGEKGKVAVSYKKESDTAYVVRADIQRIKTSKFKVSSQLKVDLTNGLDVAGQPYTRGIVSSQYTLINYKPVRELTGGFVLNNGEARFNGLRFGQIECNGAVGTKAPYDVSLAFDIKSMPMGNFIDMWMSNRKYDAEGLVSGMIKASGDVNHLFLKGDLRGSEGRIKTLDFSTVDLDIEGIYPHMQIANSRMKKTDGITFDFEGPINLSDKANFKKQLKKLVLSPVIHTSNSQHEWTIKEVKDSTAGTTSLKYLLRKELDSQESEGMLGIEKSVDF
ncbi:MAG: ribosomal protein L24 [Lysobacterales bacterium]|jgi:ribosomal protein L24